jgi:hypothetical protein
MIRFLVVLRERTDPRLRKQKILSEIMQRRQETVRRISSAKLQLQLDLEKIARLERMEQFELFLRQIHLQGVIIVTGKLKRLGDMARQKPETVHKKLIDNDAETRWMAVQVVGMKRYPFQSSLIDRLDDSDNSVRQAARQALIRVSRSNDFGPKTKASKSEREKAASQWKQWWSLQDSNPRNQLLGVVERP